MWLAETWLDEKSKDCLHLSSLCSPRCIFQNGHGLDLITVATFDLAARFRGLNDLDFARFPISSTELKLEHPDSHLIIVAWFTRSFQP